MLNTKTDVFADVASSVLETMVFAMTERLEAWPAFQADSYLLARIDYSGYRCGELAILAPISLCQEWADMMTGDASTEQVYDALAEVINTIGGNWLTEAFGASESMKLHPPQVSLADQNQWNRLAEDPTVVLLSVDDNPFILHARALD
ncbi:MAG: chemotaxis protein CheX [Rubripirellula sp.]